MNNHNHTFRLLLCGILALGINALSARNYYISSQNGSDNNSGKNPQNAWKSVLKINSTILKAGDSILFERGGRYEGELIINHSGSAKRNIVYAAYGKGNNPVLSGAIQLCGFSTTKGLQSINFPKQVNQVYINNKLQTLARTPDSGFVYMKQGFDKLSFSTCRELPDSVFADATIRMRTIDWVFENRKVEKSVNGLVTLKTPSIYKLSSGYGYYLENKASFLNQPGEWYYANGKLSLIYPENSFENKVEATVAQNAITVSKNVKNIEISGFQIEKYASYGIHIQNNAQNINVRNNKFRHIEMIAVFADSCASNIDISNNLIEDVRGRGIFGIRILNSKITHNKVLRTGMIPGLGISGVNGMIAIVIQNDEANHKTSVSNNNYIAYNYIDQNGYAGIRMDGANSICENNIVKNSSLLLNDAGGIYCFGKVKGRTFNNIIRNNLVIGVYGNNDATPENSMAANGIYIDNNSTGIKVENNTITDIVSAGIAVNDNAPQNTLTGNTIYNAYRAISFAEWANRDSIVNCVVNNNKVICTRSNQIPLVMVTYLSNGFRPGVFSNNQYINAHDGYVVEYKTDPEKGIRSTDLYRIENWKEKFGYEERSVFVKADNVKLIYNDTFDKKVIDNSQGNLTGLNNEVLGKEIVLDPCASIVVIDKNNL